MKTIIAGGRNVHDFQHVVDAVNGAPFIITEVVSGKAKGVDAMGEDWANQNGIPIKSFPANWKKYGRGAGPIRNAEMAEYAEALIACWDGESTGTKDMIAKARLSGLVVFVHRIDL